MHKVIRPRDKVFLRPIFPCFLVSDFSTLMKYICFHRHSRVCGVFFVGMRCVVDGDECGG